MGGTSVAPHAWWKLSPRYVRSRALTAIFVISAIQLIAVWGADRAWWLEAAIHFQTQYALLLLASLLGLAWVCWAERRIRLADALAGMAGLLAGGFALAAFFGITPTQMALAPPNSSADVPEGGHLRILSANVYSGNTRHEAILDLVSAERPDIVLLMELNSRWTAALAPLAAEYPFHQVWPDDRGNFGIGIWSKLPIDEWALDGFGEAYPQVRLVARLPDGGRRFRFLGLHPLPPVSANYTDRRNQLYRNVADRLAAEPQLPTIVAGDMNSTCFGPAFQSFCNETALYDGAHGRMIWRTWPAGPHGVVMGIRIDHILISEEWQVTDFRVGPNIGSDHYPIIADLQLAR